MTKLAREQVEACLRMHDSLGLSHHQLPSFARELLAAWDREARLREAVTEAIPQLQDHARWLRDIQASPQVITKAYNVAEQARAALGDTP